MRVFSCNVFSMIIKQVHIATYERFQNDAEIILNQWFEHLMQTQFQTGKAICEHYGLSVAEVSQLLNSHRPISQKQHGCFEQAIAVGRGL